MSKTSLSFAIGALIVVLLAGLSWAGLLDKLTSKLDLDILNNEEVAEETAPMAEPQSELATGNNASDQALEDDLQALDAELGTYNEASSELDASIDDQPVEQDAEF